MILPDDWEGWKTCTDENYYMRLGLDIERAASYTSIQIEAAYKERRVWWQKKPRSISPWDRRILLAEDALSQARATLTNIQKKAEYDKQLKKARDKEIEEEFQKKIDNLLRLSVYPHIKKKVLASDDEKLIMATGQELGLSGAECKGLINTALKELGAKREESVKPPAPPSPSPEDLFRDNVYSALLDGWLSPEKTRHLLRIAEKYNILWIDARRIMDKCVQEKKAKTNIEDDVNNLLDDKRLDDQRYEGKNQYDQLISDYTKTIDILSLRCACAYNNRGQVYTRKSQYDQAISDYNEAIKIKPEYVDTYKNKIIACEKAGYAQEAINTYREYIRHIPPNDISSIEEARNKMREIMTRGI